MKSRRRRSPRSRLRRVELNLLILPDGTIRGVYHDALRDLGGSMKVRRESSVEFNHTIRRWVAMKGSKFLCSHPDRDECLKLEAGIVSQLLEQEAGVKGR